MTHNWLFSSLDGVGLARNLSMPQFPNPEKTSHPLGQVESAKGAKGACKQGGGGFQAPLPPFSGGPGGGGRRGVFGISSALVFLFFPPHCLSQN